MVFDQEKELRKQANIDLSRILSPDELKNVWRFHNVQTFLNEQGEYIGVISFFVDTQLDNEKHLVISNAAGRQRNFLKTIESYCVSLAKYFECQKIRVHSRKTAMEKVLSKLNFNKTESLYLRTV